MKAAKAIRNFGYALLLLGLSGDVAIAVGVVPTTWLSAAMWAGVIGVCIAFTAKKHDKESNGTKTDS